MSLRVIEPGMLTTVQDLGRAGQSIIGVTRSGAADTAALRIGNRIIGNTDDAAALEMTLRGGEFEFIADGVVALTGAATEAQVVGGAARMVGAWEPVIVRRGERVRIGRTLDGSRTYLCIRGGIATEPVLSSRSVNVATGVGGEALRRDQVLPIGSARASPRPVPQGVRSLVASVYGRARLRVTPGPQLAAMHAEVRTGLADSMFTAQERSNRVGVRLSPLASKGEAGAGRMITEGMPPGAVQLTPEGEPIILLCDAPTTGGYPVVACVASVDFPRCGQLRPRDRVGFEFVGVDEAAQLLRSFRSGLDELLPSVEG